MEIEHEDELKEYVFHWNIENVSNFWWMIEGEEINSPIFFADALMKTKWSLRFFPMGNRVKDKISLYLYREDSSGPDVIEVHFKLAFLGKDGLLLLERSASKYQFTKGKGRGFPKFEIPRKVFLNERGNFVLEDTLTIQCTLQKAEETPFKSKHLYGQTAIKINRKNFVWRIRNCKTFETDARYKLKDTLFNLDVLLNRYSDGLDLDVISIDDSIKYISFNISVIDSQEKKEHCGFKKYFAGDLKSVRSLPLLLFNTKFVENKSWYWSKNASSLDFDLVFSTTEYFGSKDYSSGLLSSCYVEEKKYGNMEILVDDFKSLFFEGIFRDMELRTSSRAFPVHKNILSARSPVFKTMFTNDMKENHSGHVDITDIEGDIVNQMLLYIYTGTLDDLQFETASKLYAAADKYEILSLKEICSSFLKYTLCPTGVCDVLILADFHQDDDLKNAAQSYLLEHDEVFSSLEWRNFMGSHLKLASDVMYHKVNLGNI